MDKSILLTMLLFSIVIMPLASAEIINIPDDYGVIQDGINAGENGDTVLVQPGTYMENLNFNGRNIVLASLFLTTGDSSYIVNTVIDGDQAGSVVTFNNSEDSTARITGFTIRNGMAQEGGGIACYGATPVMEFNFINDNQAFHTDGGKGAGIFLSASNALVRNNLLTFNYATGPLGGFGGGLAAVGSEPIIEYNKFDNNFGGWGGGGIYFEGAYGTMSNNLIINNEANFGGGGIYCAYSSAPVITNNVISRNEARWASGGGLYVEQAAPILVNNIMWADSAFDAGHEIIIDGGAPQVNYCNIDGGWQGGVGNVDIYPIFRDPDNGDFHLMAVACGDSGDSPLIDIGDPSLTDETIDCNWGLGDQISDMGAYGGGDSVITDLQEEKPHIPSSVQLRQNYPNPFNASTNIEFEIPSTAEIRVEVYNLVGQLVDVLASGEFRSGVYTVSWNASVVSSGLYFYRLSAGEQTLTKRMLLLK